MFIDVNTSKKLKFNIEIYYIKHENKYHELNSKLLIIRKNMKFILFLNKCLIETKQWYWFTKLKIVDLIWFMQRIKYIIKVSIKLFVIVYTNYFVIVFIIQQIKLLFLSIDKLNLCLIRVSIYLLQFSLKVKHKSNSQHIISNTLSRLSINVFKFVVNNFVLNDVYW